MLSRTRPLVELKVSNYHKVLNFFYLAELKVPHYHNEGQTNTCNLPSAHDYTERASLSALKMFARHGLIIEASIKKNVFILQCEVIISRLG